MLSLKCKGPSGLVTVGPAKPATADSQANNRASYIVCNARFSNYVGGAIHGDRPCLAHIP